MSPLVVRSEVGVTIQTGLGQSSIHSPHFWGIQLHFPQGNMLPPFLDYGLGGASPSLGPRGEYPTQCWPIRAFNRSFIIRPEINQSWVPQTQNSCWKHVEQFFSFHWEWHRRGYKPGAVAAIYPHQRELPQVEDSVADRWGRGDRFLINSIGHVFNNFPLIVHILIYTTMLLLGRRQDNVIIESLSSEVKSPGFPFWFSLLAEWFLAC